ncbi:MAG: 5-keto-D-gluconate 5-reductase [Candidatus Erwinia impunctatus]|nr:5-keto-D-gluconate 5-reductase [Culicoides impunctatus]
MKNLFDLKGKRVLITGAAQGISFILAEGLGQYGAEIVVNNTTQQRADEAAEKLRQQGIIATGYGFDVTDRQQVVSNIAAIEQQVGAIDVLINNAGVQRRHPFTEFPEEAGIK